MPIDDQQFKIQAKDPEKSSQPALLLCIGLLDEVQNSAKTGSQPLYIEQNATDQ
jgi:hypothetical protein